MVQTGSSRNIYLRVHVNSYLRHIANLRHISNDYFLNFNIFFWY